MSYIYRLLKLRIYEYRNDGKLFKNTHKYPISIYKDFDKIPNNRIAKTIDTLENNISNEHIILDKYPNIVKFINTYYITFIDCMDVIFDEFEKYKEHLVDKHYLLNIGFTNNMLKYNISSLSPFYL